ncbi:MAG: ribosome silencing factor [Rhodoferax sp.]
MSTTTTEKRDVQKLQRAIVDGLEDVKAQDIKVFDTAHLSPLFERVVIASGTSNRQTKALAASVLDAVRDAGFTKPRVEGEGNGEWIIVDCGQAVVHIMQPTFRSYYLLEDLWGEKPVRLKLGAAKPTPAKTATSKKTAASTPKDDAPTSLKRSSAAKKGVAEAFPSKAALKKAAAKAAPAAAKKAAPRKAAAGAAGAAAKAAAGPRKKPTAVAPKVVVNAPKSAPKKSPAAKKAVAAKKPAPAAAKKAPARKTSSRSA